MLFMAGFTLILIWISDYPKWMPRPVVEFVKVMLSALALIAVHFMFAIFLVLFFLQILKYHYLWRSNKRYFRVVLKRWYRKIDGFISKERNENGRHPERY